MQFCFLDTETGGLDPTRDALLAIGAVKFEAKDGSLHVTDAARWLVRPAGRLTVCMEALKVQGLTWADLESTERVAESEAYAGLNQFFSFGDGIPTCGIWAHNAPFDEGFLRAFETRVIHGDICRRVPIRPALSCSLALARMLRGRGADLPTLAHGGSLDSLAAHFEIPRPTPHDALADCHTGVRVLESLWRLAGWLPAQGESEAGR